MRAAAGSVFRQIATGATPIRPSVRHFQPRSVNRAIQWQASSRAQNVWRPFVSTRWMADSSKSTPGDAGSTFNELKQASSVDRPTGDMTTLQPARARNDSTIGTTEARLPSESVSRRHALSARMSQTTDRLLASLASTSQRVNEYTGTDYTGIASLRADIIALEGTVKELLSKVGDAKAAHDAAVAAQGAGQKEVVQLLERKHSWADGDLERYMALIRSEHEHDAAVKSARDILRTLEHELEETRAQLERKERTQYHEEQVWSDNIRRNSTWVTFGLMGFNVFLLLANVIIIEPWRRRRLVRELKSEMDDRMVPAASAPPVDGEVLQAIDEAIPPADVPLPDIQTEAAAIPPLKPSPSLPPRHAVFLQRYFGDLFSDRIVMIRKLDITTIAVESAAAGAAIVGLFVFWFRSV